MFPLLFVSQPHFHPMLLDSRALFYEVRSGWLHPKFFLLPFSFKKKEVFLPTFSFQEKVGGISHGNMI